MAAFRRGISALVAPQYNETTVTAATAPAPPSQAAFGAFTVDGFASGATALLPRFWADAPTAGAEGTDAFTQRWEGEHLLAHAPVGRLLDVAAKLRATPGASAVVVAPYWKGALWYGELRALCADLLVLPPGSLAAVDVPRTAHVRGWRAVAFHVPRRD